MRHRLFARPFCSVESLSRWKNCPLSSISLARVWKARKQAAGWTIIPADVDGEGTSYCVEWETSPTGIPTNPPTFSYVERWVRLVPGSTETYSDEAGYHQWARDLVTRGILEAPQPHVLRALLVKIEESAKAEREQTPEAIARRARFLADAAVVRDELEAARRREAEFNAAPAEVLS